MRIAVIGGGLAGTFLCYEILKHEKINITLFDARSNSASRISAGIVNVISGPKFTLTWNAKKLVEILHNELQNPIINKHFNHKLIYKPFPDLHMKDKVINKTLNKDYKYFVDINDVPIEGIHNPYGGAFIKHLGYFNVNSLLDSVQNFLRQNYGLKIVSTKVPYEEIHINNKIKILSETFDKVIFCEGVGIFNNPYFSSKKINSLKGEIITLRVPNLTLDYIVINKVYIIPLGDNLYNIGSTYERGIIDFSTTDVAREQLIKKFLETVGKRSYKLIEHSAGVRVTTFDHRLFVGEHPHYKNVYFFNGLGTKGLLQSCYGAEQLSKLILYNKDVEPAIDLRRIMD